MNKVYLFPGFMASDLGVISDGEKVWWDPNAVAVLGIGALRLAADGVSPGPPDGEACAVFLPPQSPWDDVLSLLRSQLDQTVWQLAVGTYDWRLDLRTQATQLAANIRQNNTPAFPATLVGHSMGGLICVLAYAQLVGTGQANLVRRLITLGTPFQGSYLPVNFLTGLSASQAQLLAMGLWAGNPASRPLSVWTLAFLNALCLTWPAFYCLFPGLGGSEFAMDPNRGALYTATNYAATYSPSQAWLDFARNTLQPLVRNINTFPPDYVATYVYGVGLDTPAILDSSATPLDLFGISTTPLGDGVVTAGSAFRSPGLAVQVVCDHSSLPLALARSGALANFITDPRGPLDPPPSKLIIPDPFGENVTPPPQADPVSGLQCLSGG